jgi:hypothetical protein
MAGPPQAPTQRDTPQVTLGNALLTIADPLFLEGYSRGFREYGRYDSTEPLSDVSIRALLRKRQRNTTHAEMWNVGYVMGWITATHGIPRLRHYCKPARHHWQQQAAEAVLPLMTTVHER